MQVERLSTRASSDLRKALKSAKNRALLIPWSYGPDCAAATYEGSALWLSPGTRGLFGAVLRPRNEWVNGVPTFDTGHPRNTPFPVAEAYHREARAHALLSPDEMLDLVDSVPRFASDRGDVVAKYFRDMKRWHAVLRWADKHPDQAMRWPLADWVSGARDGIATAAFDTIISPFAGTYRFVIEIPGRDSLVFFGRTDLRPRSIVWNDGINESRRRDLADPYGYYLLVGSAQVVGELPAGFPRERQGFLSFAFKPSKNTVDSTVWDGGMELLLAASEMAGDPAIRITLNEARRSSLQRYSTRRTPLMPGTMVRRQDGSLYMSLTMLDEKGTTIRIRGTRISLETLRRE